MNEIVKKFYSLDELFLSSILLWIYRIGITLIAVWGVLQGISEMSQNFGGGVFTIFIATPIAMVVFRIWIELLYLIVGIFNKLSDIKNILQEKKSDCRCDCAEGEKSAEAAQTSACCCASESDGNASESPEQKQ